MNQKIAPFWRDFCIPLMYNNDKLMAEIFFGVYKNSKNIAWVIEKTIQTIERVLKNPLFNKMPNIQSTTPAKKSMQIDKKLM